MKMYTLNNGKTIPAIGFGTFKARDGEEAYKSTLSALQAGYRHIDTAAIYGNEESVGRAIKDSGLERDELFITTKLWNTAHTKQEAHQALNASLSKLGLDYVDLYLVHWPNPKSLRDGSWKRRNADIWKALEEEVALGRVRSIGVSNFMVHHLEALFETATIVPAVNQIRLAPGVLQEEVVSFCKDKKILLEAWGPFGQGELFSHPTAKRLAENYQVTVAQLALAWSLAHGFLPLPKSVTPERIVSNLEVPQVALSFEDMQALDTLSGVSGAADPDKVDF
ncbi:aldo/keto reductase [Streptococcus sciuri]|uniref:Aldo/keto reductase n=1 Tax=Streptococcus sciuri TaxID=2973939 RepID=A0ABT2F8B0_9STRE|nr:aldo/keto reductase [Streptococcus sciuri]MCS4488630.1 aldo/keto reductase [Streptococcus sciuri]